MQACQPASCCTCLLPVDVLVAYSSEMVHLDPSGSGMWILGAAVFTLVVPVQESICPLFIFSPFP